LCIGSGCDGSGGGCNDDDVGGRRCCDGGRGSDGYGCIDGRNKNE
jgi:hypothetical protein